MLQIQHDNQRDFNVEKMLMFDLHVYSMSKWHQININSKPQT